MNKKQFEALLAGVRQMDRHMRGKSVPGVRVTRIKKQIEKVLVKRP